MYSQLRWLILSDHHKAIAEDPSLHKAANKTFFDNRLEFPNNWPNAADSLIFVQPQFLADLFSEQENTAPADTIFSQRYASPWRTLHQRRMRQDIGGVDEPLALFTQFVSELMRKDVAEWQESLEPWSRLVDRGFDESAGSQLMLQNAMVATGATAKPAVGAWDENGFAATKGLVRRLFFARHKSNDVNWWRARLADVTIETTGPAPLRLVVPGERQN